MIRYCLGSHLFCKIRGNSIVPTIEDKYDTVLSFIVVGYDINNDKYLLSIPKYYSIKNAWNVVEEHLEKYGLDPDLLDTKAISISNDKIYKVKFKNKSDGMHCSRCEEFFAMTEANQPDGTFTCFQCRNSPWR